MATMIYSAWVTGKFGNAFFSIIQQLDEHVVLGHLRRNPSSEKKEIGYTLPFDKDQDSCIVIAPYRSEVDEPSATVTITGEDKIIRQTKSQLLKLVDGLNLY